MARAKRSGHSYEWREGSPWQAMGVSAQEVGERIEQLSANGPVSKEIIVRDAENPRSPLHRCFDWNDTTAAEKYRKHQASLLTGQIVQVRMVPGDGKQETRSFVSVSYDSPNAMRGYVHVTKAVGYDIVGKARGELVAWCRRYAGVKEMHDLVAAVYSQVEAPAPQRLRRTG